MDSCILIPKQLSLVLTLHPDPTNLLEMCVAVWSNCNLPTGTTLHPDEGEIKYEKLETFSVLKSDNIRHQFGCYDEILTVDNREVRHCNWIRFIKSSSKLEEVNVIGIKLKGEIVFQLIKDVQPNEEIVVYFQTLQDERLVEEEKVHQHVLDETKTPVSTSADYPSPILPIATRISRSGITSGSDDSGNFSDSPSTREPSPVTEYKNIPAKRSRERTWLPCDVCKKKFDRPSLLKRHMRTHTGEKPHVCETCNKAFSTSSSLNTHRRIHSGEKPHVCNICGKKFTASSNLYYHRMTHNKDKPHKCTECSKSFPTPGDLKSHMYVHNGSWPFKCQICNRGFSKQTNLKNHLVLHSGDRPHQCLTCNKSFSLACNLKTHMKIHEEDSSPVCTRCNKMATTSDGFCLKCRGDVRISPDYSHTDSYLSNSKTSHSPSFTSSQLSSDMTSQSPSGFMSSRSPSDFSISKITERSFKRQRLESNNFNNGSHSPYPVYCSTPVSNQTLFSTMSPSPQSNHFLSAMLLSRNTPHHLGSGLMTPGY